MYPVRLLFRKNLWIGEYNTNNNEKSAIDYYLNRIDDLNRPSGRYVIPIISSYY